MVTFSCVNHGPLVIIPVKPKPFGGKNMKTRLTVALAAVLTVSLLTGCGCTNRNVTKDPEPTVLPTNEEVWDTTETTVNPTIATATAPTDTMTTETTDSTVNPTDITDGTADATVSTDNAARSRRMMPDMR